MFKLKCLLSTLFLAFFVFQSFSSPQSQQGEEEVLLLQADSVNYNEKETKIIAKGRVKLRYAGRTLLADKVIYNEKTEIFKAQGHVILIEKEDKIAFFSDEVALNKAFSAGYFEPLKARMGRYARITSKGGKVLDAENIAFYKASYTPCKLCQLDPTRPPLWQLNSEETIENHETNMLTHKHTWLEFLGKPLFYVPYFIHPDPTITQKTGVLMPSYTASRYLGNTLNLPIYWGIDPSHDFTLNIQQSENQGTLIGGKWRHQMAHGYYEIDGAFTQSDYIKKRPGKKTDNQGKQDRYHLFGKGDFELNDYFRWGFDLNEVSDNQYLDDYGFSHSRGIMNHKSILTNSLYLEGFEERDYLSVRLYDFDDIRAPEDRGNAPRILPFAEVSALGDPASFFGGRISFDANFIVLERSHDKHHKDDQDYKRLMGNLGWARTFKANNGLVSTIQAHGIARYYKINHYRGARAMPMLPEGKGQAFSDLTSQLAYKASYPFYKRYASFDHIVEPVVAFIYNAYKKGENKFPNEDSVDLELDSANLFALNMNPGYDRIDQGPRVAYGISTGFYGDKQGSLEALIGQTKRFNQRQTSRIGTGLDQKTSDIIGHIIAKPSPYLDAAYYFRNDGDSFKRRYYKLEANAGPAIFKPGITYLFVDQPLEKSINDSKRERTLRISSQLTDYWTFTAYNTKNLGPRKNKDRGSRISAATLIYDDECFTFQINAERNHYKRTTRKPEDQIYARFILKTMGGIATPKWSNNSNYRSRGSKRSSSF